MRTQKPIAYLALAFVFAMTNPVHAQVLVPEQDPNIPNMIEEINPQDPNIEEHLQELDRLYEEETGKPSHLIDESFMNDILGKGCSRSSCKVWVQVVKSSQRLYLYLNGSLADSWAVSTGMSGYGTPNFDKHPDGRIYDAYSSDKYPGGDWNGLGNMPYAVFIAGGYALHGTPRGNWPKLGSPASHGCIRMLPDNAYRFNRLVRSNGVSNVWITVQ